MLVSCIITACLAFLLGTLLGVGVGLGWCLRVLPEAEKQLVDIESGCEPGLPPLEPVCFPRECFKGDWHDDELYYTSLGQDITGLTSLD